MKTASYTLKAAKAYNKRKNEAGYKRASFWLTKETAAKIDQKAIELGVTKMDLLNHLEF